MLVKYLKLLLLCLIALPSSVLAQDGKLPDTQNYLSDVKTELQVLWPKSRTINVVFHGHSVPAGYWTNHEVHTLESYPHLVLQKLKIGLADPYPKFKAIASEGNLKDYMSHVNHPNLQGHKLIADEVMKWFDKP